MEAPDANLLPIGRFARLTGLTVKALRHYDEVGLLRPAAVDPASGYRLYAPEQGARAEAIRRLRRLELNVALQGLQPLIDGKETVMTTPAEALDRDAHRRLGIDLFNKAWTLMEKPGRTPADDDELIHCAHASAYHWLHAGGTGAKRARSEWQCSRVYAVLGRAEPALHHARRCLDAGSSRLRPRWRSSTSRSPTRRSPAHTRSRATRQRRASGSHGRARRGRRSRTRTTARCSRPTWRRSAPERRTRAVLGEC
jgi:DNA-binding transcriptional MerR regulator